MSNVINVEFSKEEENTYKMHGGVLRATENIASGATIGVMAEDAFTISIQDKMAVMPRKEMAEFLWMAAYMVDSEQRWAKDEYVGLNYKDGER